MIQTVGKLKLEIRAQFALKSAKQEARGMIRRRNTVLLRYLVIAKAKPFSTQIVSIFAKREDLGRTKGPSASRQEISTKTRFFQNC